MNCGWAIKAAAAGQVPMSPLVADATPTRGAYPPESPEPLTERETEVLRQLALGNSIRKSPAELVIAEKTARTHVVFWPSWR